MTKRPPAFERDFRTDPRLPTERRSENDNRLRYDWSSGEWTSGADWMAGDWLRSGWIGPDPHHPLAPIEPGAFLRACGVALTALTAWPVYLIELMQRSRQRDRERRMLHKMTDHQLKDIGLSRADIHGGLGRRRH